MEKRIYGIAALFDNPDRLMKATKNTAALGVQKWDVHTPYPVHGLDDAMGLRPSRIAWVTLIAALSAGAFSIYFMWQIMADTYPLVIGGKPFFSLPAFVPIWFAFSVLISVIATVFCLFAVWLKFPAASHPLQGSEYLRATGSDRYGICVEAEDSVFDESMLRSHFEELGALSVELLYYEEETAEGNRIGIPGTKFSIAWNESFFLIFLLLVIGGVSFKVYTIYNQVLYDRLPLIHETDPLTGINLREMGITKRAPFTWMDTQDKVAAQKENFFFEDGSAMRRPVEGTVARGFLPYAYAGDPEGAGRELFNPLPTTRAVLDEGRDKFNIYCSVCHGYFGNAKSRLNGQFAIPPSLHTNKLKTWPDGRIFHVITEGQYQMPSYASQISREDRWKIVHYVRTLQRAQDAHPGDLDKGGE